jgi:hypothetical protein
LVDGPRQARLLSFAESPKVYQSGMMLVSQVY